MTLFADADITLRDLAATMADAAVGPLVAQGADRSSTIVTERDIVETLADGADPDDMWAGEVSSLDLTAAGPDDRVVDVVRAMVEQNIRTSRCWPTTRSSGWFRPVTSCG